MAKKKTITLKQKGYRCNGYALLNLWGGGQGTVDMNWWDCGTLNKADILKGVNDGQFGCESIESATVYVSEHYERGFTELTPCEVFEFTADELKQAKRGI